MQERQSREILRRYFAGLCYIPILMPFNAKLWLAGQSMVGKKGNICGHRRSPQRVTSGNVTVHLEVKGLKWNSVICRDCSFLQGFSRCFVLFCFFLNVSLCLLPLNLNDVTRKAIGARKATLKLSHKSARVIDF